jgi:predicted esterase
MSSPTIEHMEVEVDGAGQAIILIHGLGGSLNTFCPQPGARESPHDRLDDIAAVIGRIAFDPASGRVVRYI